MISSIVSYVLIYHDFKLRKKRMCFMNSVRDLTLSRKLLTISLLR